MQDTGMGQLTLFAKVPLARYGLRAGARVR